MCDAWNSSFAGAVGSSEEFASAIRNTDNYYVIVSRESLSNLPYSVTEVYGIHSSGKFAYQEPVYHQMYRIYGDYQKLEQSGTDKLLVEDSNAGYEFFSGLSCKAGIKCFSAEGAGNVFGMLQQEFCKDGITVIADGAAHRL